MEQSFQIKTTLTKVQTINVENYPSWYTKEDIIKYEQDPETIIDGFEMDGGEGWEFKVEECKDGNQ